MAYKRLFPRTIGEEDKKRSNKWVKLNDERVSVIEEADLLSRKGSVYLLFYEKIHKKIVETSREDLEDEVDDDK